ncbi:MAG: hypothetical protein ACP5N2_04820 [Candidatus Nanoarchaeia archaeon]
MASTFNLSEFTFFEEATGMLANIEYGNLEIFFDMRARRVLTADDVREFYSDARGFLDLYNSKDVVSDTVAFESAKSIATLVTQFVKYHAEVSDNALDKRTLSLVNKPSDQYAFELTDLNKSRVAYDELDECLNRAGYLLGMKTD